MNPDILLPAIGKIEQTRLSSLGRATGLGEGKTLTSKSKECCSRESVAQSCIILQLLAYPKCVADSIQAFITLNKNHR